MPEPVHDAEGDPATALCVWGAGDVLGHSDGALFLCSVLGGGTEVGVIFLEGDVPTERKLVLVAIEPDGRLCNVTLPAASWDTLVSPAGVDQCWTPAIQTLRDFYADRERKQL